MSSDNRWSKPTYDRPNRTWEEVKLAEAEVQVENLEEQVRTLTRVAVGVMETLAEVGQEDFVLLKNENIREWWTAYKTKQLKDAKGQLEKTRIEAAKHKSTYEAFEEVLAIREQEVAELEGKL